MGGSEVTFHERDGRDGCRAESSPVRVFVDLGGLVTGLVEIVRVKESWQPVDPRDYPSVGQEITAVVLGAIDLQRQVHLSIRPSDLASS
jgi:ribosomal protein S1